MPNPSIAGPRRPRAAPPGVEPSVVIPPPADSAPTTPYLRRSDIHTLTRHPATRPLPPLDYDDSGRLPRSMPSTQPGKRRKAHRLRWLVLGMALGAAASVLARGDGPATIRSLRFWGADILRSLEHRPPRPMGTHATAVAPAPVSAPARAHAPASVLAPALTLAMNVPTVRVDDLPRAQPPRPPVVARHRRTSSASVGHAAAPAAAADDGQDDAQDAMQDPSPSDDDTAADTAGANPYVDDQPSANGGR